MGPRVHVIVFIDFKLNTSAEFDTVDQADAYARGLRRGFTLSQPIAAPHPMLYAVVLPRDEVEMRDIIPPDEVERVFREVNL